MTKAYFKNILRNHSFAMLICCAIPLIAISVLSFTGILGQWGLYALILLCPILHFMVMLKHH